MACVSSTAGDIEVAAADIAIGRYQDAGVNHGQAAEEPEVPEAYVEERLSAVNELARTAVTDEDEMYRSNV